MSLILHSLQSSRSSLSWLSSKAVSWLSSHAVSWLSYAGLPITWPFNNQIYTVIQSYTMCHTIIHSASHNHTSWELVNVISLFLSVFFMLCYPLQSHIRIVVLGRVDCQGHLRQSHIQNARKQNDGHTSCSQQCAMCMAEVYFSGNLVTTVSDKFFTWGDKM